MINILFICLISSNNIKLLLHLLNLVLKPHIIEFYIKKQKILEDIKILSSK